VTTGLLELGEIMVAGAQRRLDTVSQNVANITTPGYRKGVAFAEVAANGANSLAFSTNHESGALRVTGQPLDLAISGAGFFRVRGDNGVYYTRSGQFSRDSEGRLVDGQGMVLQTADGHDLVLTNRRIAIAEDGAVLEDGVPVARVGLFECLPDMALERVSGAYFAAPADAMQEVASPLVRQGMIEGSNVDLPGEMIAMMTALRQAEVGARVVQTYDALIGQAISTLGRAPA
jgi:flagellar basal-body rod protein FlgF